MVKTGLKQLFGVMKRSEDKKALREYIEENADEFSHLDEETFDVMSVMVNQKYLVKYKESCKSERGEMDMCKAIEDIREEGREEVAIKLMTQFSITKEKSEEYIEKMETYCVNCHSIL